MSIEEGYKHLPRNKRPSANQGHKITEVTQITEAEARRLGEKAYETWKQEQPDPSVKDNYQPGDRNVFEKGVVVTKTREVEGYKLQRRNPFGHWYILNLEELGSFTDQKSAHDALLKYLETKQSDAQGE
jgi:hypothetical protein